MCFTKSLSFTKMRDDYAIVAVNMKRFIFVLLAFFCISNKGMAFDNKRSGFIIGGFGGPAIVIWNQSVDGTTSDTMTDFAAHVDLRIGGGFKGDNVMLYFLADFNMLEMTNWLGIDIPVDASFGGLGISYYFMPSAPSLYVIGGGGISLWGGGGTAIWWQGFGLTGGVGYEFVPHWSIEFDVMWGNPSIELLDITLQTNFLALTLSIIGIAY